MSTSRTTVRSRFGDFFAVDDDWARPTPRVGRSDVIVGLVMETAGIVTLELSRSTGALSEVDAPWWVQYLVLSAGALALVWRRRYPVAVAVYLAAHMFITGVTMAPVMAQLSLQICYFLGLFSAMSWGRSRRTSLVAAGAILTFMLCWVAWQFAVGSGMQEFVDDIRGTDDSGFLPAIPSAVLMTFFVNLLYFLGAIIGGQVAWRGARQRERLAEQARTISEQADTLRRRAVVDERLRIARELHDVVGHHVSVIGVQAAGARRVLGRNPEAAEAALGAIEDSSRAAVTQMRSLLGTLRDIEAEASGEATGAQGRTSGPGASDLPDLVASRDGTPLHATYDVVVDRSDAVGRLPAAVGLSLYRTVQEALANVTRHSTATHASVTLRVVEAGPHPFAEVEVLDDGRLRPGTSGSGLGVLGIRERAASHRGECEIGPRATRGYRVRVRLPLAVPELPDESTPPQEAAARG